jgi:hypothetical protein
MQYDRDLADQVEGDFGRHSPSRWRSTSSRQCRRMAFSRSSFGTGVPSVQA